MLLHVQRKSFADQIVPDLPVSAGGLALHVVGQLAGGGGGHTERGGHQLRRELLIEVQRLKVHVALIADLRQRVGHGVPVMLAEVGNGVRVGQVIRIVHVEHGEALGLHRGDEILRLAAGQRAVTKVAAALEAIALEGIDEAVDMLGRAVLREEALALLDEILNDPGTDKTQYDKAQAEGAEFLVLTASSDMIDEFKQEHNLPYQFALTDPIQLKTMVRSNPGVVILEGSKVVDKFNPNWKYCKK